MSIIAAGALLALGYLVGADGQKKLVVCPCGPDGKPDIPAIPTQSTLPIEMPGIPSSPALPSFMVLVPIQKELTSRNFRPVGTSTTQGIADMVDTQGADKIVLYVLSTMDQAVTIQLVGAYQNVPGNTANLINIGSSFSQGVGNTTQSINAIELVLDEIWHPYLGITVATGGTAPTVGALQVFARGQRWVRASDVEPGQRM